MATLSPSIAGTRTRAGTAPMRHVDLVLLCTPIAISALGLLVIYSSTRTRLEAQGLGSLYYVQRQGLALLLGVVVMMAAMVVDYRRIRDIWPLVYLAVLPLLMGVLLFGVSRKGAQAWFPVGPLQFQPSELAKIAVIVALAGFCHQHRGVLDPLQLATAVLLAGLPIGLVLLQNDLGTAMVISVSAGAVLLVAGIRPLHVLVLLLLGVTAIGAAWGTGYLEGYKLDRLTTFLSQPEELSPDSSPAEYNTEQAKTAIGAGGLTGAGLFEGTQTKLSYVPEQHTDFIFTVVGEEFGFVGGASLLALYAVLAWRIWRTAVLSADAFGTFVSVGVLAMISFQVFESIGMTTGIMPVTGIPLPFLSYGGSALITSFLAVGLVANVHMRRFS